MDGPTIIILGGSSSDELIERGLKFVLKLFFDKITFKFIFYFYFFYFYLKKFFFLTFSTSFF